MSEDKHNKSLEESLLTPIAPAFVESSSSTSISEVLSPKTSPYAVMSIETAIISAVTHLGEALKTPVRLDFAMADTAVSYGASEHLPHSINILPGVNLSLGRPPCNLTSDAKDYLRMISPYFSLALTAILESESRRKLSLTDPLTSLKNRRALDKLLFDELLELRKKEIHNRRDDDSGSRGIAAIMLDVDNFKHYNDKHGHQRADAVLRSVGQYLMHRRRTTDGVFRYGGEEFTIVLSNCSLKDAIGNAEQIREYVHTQSIEDASNGLIPAPFTISLGVAHTHEIVSEFRYDSSEKPLGGGYDFALLELADMRLYEAKRGGRNKVNSIYFPAAKPLDE